MKKLVRIMGLCALVSLALVSCKKTETKTFRISSARVSSDSRTHIEVDYNVKQLVWDANDEIKVFRHDQPGQYTTFTVAAADQGNSVATFNIVGDQINFMNELGKGGDNNYSAFYPYAVGQGNEVRVPVLARQEFIGLDFLPNTFPMYGNDNAAGDFEFSSNAGLLVIEFQRRPGCTDAECTLDSLELVAMNPEKYLAGNFVYHNDGTPNETPGFEGTSNAIMLVPENPIMIPELPNVTGISISWLFVLPEVDLTDGFYLRGYHDGQQVFERSGVCNIHKGMMTAMNGKIVLPVQ